MTLIRFEELRHDTVLHAARLMLIAAKTAPKGRGQETLEYALADGPDRDRIAQKMEEIGARAGVPHILRDAANVRKAEAVVLIGTKIAPLGLKLCGMCGFADCAEKEKHPAVPCFYNTVNLGIAVGSACAAAADLRIDNRIMYSIGLAAKELGLLGPDIVAIYGIPLSATEKNIFFDRT